MSEERKPTPPSYPRPSQSRFPSVRRPLVPVKSQTPTSTQNTNRMESRIPRPVRPFRTPVSPLQRVADLSKRSLIPAPPTTPKSPGLQRRRPVSSASLAPLKRTEGRSFSVEDKYVQKMDEDKNNDQAQQKSSQAKDEITKSGKTSEEVKPVAIYKRDPKKGPLFNQASPPALEFFQKEGLKITPSNSFEALSNGSNIPVLIKPSKPRQKTSSGPSKVKANQPKDEKPDDVEVVDEPTVASRANPGNNTTTGNAIAKSDERPSNTKKRQPPSLRPAIPHRLEPLRRPATNGDENHGTPEDLRAVEENPNVFGRFSSKLQRERHNMKEHGEVLPSMFTPDRKNTELEKVVQAAGENPNPLDCSSSTLGDILPSRLTPENNTAVLEKITSEPSKDCTTQHPVNQMAILEMIEEMQQLKDHLKDVKARQCSKTKNNTYVLDTKDQELDQSAHPVKYVKAMVNDMNVMVKDIDLDMTCVHQAAKEVVESMVERLKKSKDNFDETLLTHEKEILRLQGVNNETQYLLVEGDAKFKSLEKAIDLTNEEYEKLQKHNADLLEDNNRLEAECQKMNDDMIFRAKELGSEDLLEQNKGLAAENDKLKLEETFRVRELTNLQLEIQRRDTRSYQLLDEYHVMWKDKSSLNLKVEALETELQQTEHARLSLHEHNSALGCKIAAMEDHIRELENHNSYLSGTSDASMSNESEELTNNRSEIDPDKVEDTEPQQTGDVPNIGITEHVLFVENGKIINGLAESSKKMPTASLDAIKNIEKPSHIITRDGKKIQKYQSVESKTIPEQANQSVSILKMMSEKIQRLGKKNAEEQKCEDGFDDTVFTNNTEEEVDKPFNNMVESPAFSKSVAGMAGETAEETVQGAVEETHDNVLQSPACSKSVAGMAEETAEETAVQGAVDERLESMVQSSACSKPVAGMAEETNIETTATSEPVIEGMLNESIIPQGSFEDHVEESNAQEPLNEVPGYVTAAGQEVANEIPSLGVESSISAQENSGIEIAEPATIQLQCSLGEPVNMTNAQYSGDKQGEQHAAVFQDFKTDNQVDWVIQEQHNQLTELQTIIDILREKNAQLENEKVEIISEHQGFLLENMQEVKRLKKLEQCLNERERMFQAGELKNNNQSPKKSKLELKEEADWYDECVKASQRIRQIENLMAKQDKMLNDLENDRDRLLKVNKDLRLEMANMLSEDASFLGLPKPLQGLEDILKQLRRSKVVCNGVRKKIRCYTKCDVAIEELQKMKPDTLVISIGDFAPNEDEQPRAKTPITHEQLLIKKPKMIKRHRMKNMQNRLFQNPSAVGSTLNGSGGAAFPAGIRPRHKRKNPSILLRCSQNLTRINEGRDELLAERLEENFDESNEETDQEETGMETVEINAIAVGEMEDTGMETVEVNGTAVGEMEDTGMETVEVNGTAVGEMEDRRMETVEVNAIAVGEMEDTGMETVEVNVTAVGEKQDTGMETAEVNGTAVGEMQDRGMETVEVNVTAVGEMQDTGMETVEVNGTAVGEMQDTGMETVEVNVTAVEEMQDTGMETVEVNVTAVGEMQDTGMETVEVNGTAVGEKQDRGMETAEVNVTAVGEMQDTGMETVEVNGTAVGEMQDTGMETVEVNVTAVEEMQDTGMETVEVNGTAVGEMQDTGMETAEVNVTAVGEMQDTGMETAEVNGTAVGEMQDTGMETVEVNGTAVGEMQDTGMETVEVNVTAVGEMQDTGMETVEVNGTAVGEMQDRGMETVEVNAIAVGEMQDRGMETVEVNAIAVGEIQDRGMETAEVNAIAVGEMQDRGMETVEVNAIAVGHMEDTGIETFEGCADEMLDGSATEMLSKRVFAEIEKENAEVFGENYTTVPRSDCSKSVAGMPEETLGTEIYDDDKDEWPLASANRLFESARQLEILRKILTKKPSKLKKKNVDRMA